MEKIFLAPVSGSNLFANYKKTVVEGIPSDSFLKIPEAKEYSKQFSKEDKIHLWGIKSTKATPFKKCSVNDYVLYYYQGTMISYCKVLYKSQNKPLSEKIWGKDTDRITGLHEYWENLLFLTAPKKISMDFNILIDFAHFKPKASVRGFNAYSSVGLSAIINKYKTIDTFLNKYSNT